MTSKTTEKQPLLSHAACMKDINQVIEKITHRIKQQGDKQYVTVKKQLELLHQLNQFEFGQYLLLNQGINGYWTHYMLTHPWFGRKTGRNNQGQPFSSLEQFMLDRAPLMLATQERFEIFLKENQKSVKDGAQLACIPCGMLGELLYLNFDDVHSYKLIGIDYDPQALIDAQGLSESEGLSSVVTLIQANAWDLKTNQEFDLISSNGLTIYEPNDEKIIELYRIFFNSLKTGGKLVTSYVTPPPGMTERCEWELSSLNQEDLLLQKIIFADILEAKWQCYRSTDKTEELLKSAGFDELQFIYDEAKMFPTVAAYKK